MGGESGAAGWEEGGWVRAYLELVLPRLGGGRRIEEVDCEDLEYGGVSGWAVGRRSLFQLGGERLPSWRFCSCALVRFACRLLCLFLSVWKGSFECSCGRDCGCLWWMSQCSCAVCGSDKF